MTEYKVMMNEKSGTVFVEWPKQNIKLNIPRKDANNGKYEKWGKKLIKLELYPKAEGIGKAIKLLNKVRIKYNKIKERREATLKDITYIDPTTGKEKPDIDGISEAILKQYSIKTIFGLKYNILWIYEEGIWKPTGTEFINVKVEKMINSLCGNHIVNEVIGKIARKTSIKTEEFNKQKDGLICLKNGILDLNKNKLLEFKPEYYLKKRIPLTYNPKAKCPKIMKFIKDSFYPEHINLIQEWLGFSLFNRYFEKKSIILFGATNTGKTTFLNLLKKYMGINNVSSVGLHRITMGDTKAIIELKDCYLNVVDDLSSKDIDHIGRFKEACGDGDLTGDKKFRDPETFRNFAKHVFACNVIPSIKEINDNAYYSRIMPVPMDNQVKEMNKNLIKELAAEEELSGLLNWALEGLKRLIENNGFTYEKDPKDVKNLMMRSGDSLTAFVQDCVHNQDGAKIRKSTFFELYGLYCELHGILRFSKEQVGRNLLSKTNYITAHHGTVRWWENLAINADTYDTFLKIKHGDRNNIIDKIKNDIVLINTGKVSKASNEDAKIDSFIDKEGIS